MNGYISTRTDTEQYHSRVLLGTLLTKRGLLRFIPESLEARIFRWLNAFGVDLFKTKHALKGIGKLVGDYRQYKTLAGNKTYFPLSFSYPCPADYYEPAGTASGHYFHQDLLVAQKIFEHNPARHVDVGSRIDGFVAHVASFREIEVLDIRPLSSEVKNMVFRRFDLMAPVEDFQQYCESLSCLHVLEHLGLGRYGDSIQPEGYSIGFDHLYALLKPAGTLYLSVPIGSQRVEFNAHRIFSVSTILELARERMELIDFSYVDDRGDLHTQAALTTSNIETSFGCQYGCGIFEFRKRAGTIH